MRIAIVESSNGASGDMLIASMLGIVIDERDLRKIKDDLGLNLEFKVEEVVKSGVRAKKLVIKEKKVERTFKEVTNMIRSLRGEFATIAPIAIGIFRRMAEAEAKVHGKEVDEIVFHEIGSDDAIFDVLAASLGFKRLKERGYEIFSTPINLGGGEVETPHGVYPVPPPAVLEIIKNSKLEVFFGRVEDGELLTPTAAAILAEFSEGSFYQTFKVEEIGYGAGERETSKPNVLRLIIGSTTTADRIAIVETNVDDASGEIIGNAINTLMQKSLDVIAIPYFGKKNRPGFLLKAICELDEADEVAELMMEETGSIGVRIIPVHHRIVSFREIGEKELSIGGKKFRVRVKTSYPAGKLVKPEFDDVRKIASDLGISLPEAYREVLKRI